MDGEAIQSGGPRRELLVNRTTTETRVALLEDGRVTEIFIEKEENRSPVGNIYKGRVSKILPGMQSAFVEIGLSRDAFLHVHDLLGVRRRRPADGPADGEDPPQELSVPRVESLLEVGQELVVQLVKEPILGKGARIKTQVTLPGRTLVLMPEVDHIGVSRRIEDADERERLRELASALCGRGEGLIVRTAAEGAGADELAADFRYLQGVWGELCRRAQVAAPGTLLHAEFDPVRRVLRDLYSQDFTRIVVDDRLIFRDCQEFLQAMQPGAEQCLEYDGRPGPLFDRCHVQEELDRALRSRIWLQSGGSIVINQTEALVAIDVNTGKYVGKRGLEETVLRTNLEAAVEIVRQLRLRDLGGIIVVDFIDMEEDASKRRLLEALESELQRDRARTKILQISEFGLVEITRQRTRRSLERTLCRPCPDCHGSGRIKTRETLYFEIQRELQRLAPASQEGVLVIRSHPDVADLLENRRHALLDALAPGHGLHLVLERDPLLGHEQFEILNLPGDENR